MRTLWRVVGVVVFAIAVAAFDLLTSERHGFFDLKVYWGALNYWWNHGGMIYDYLNPNTLYGFTYPPFAALVMLPMAWVQWETAIRISVVLTVIVSAFLVWWMAKRSRTVRAGRRGSSSRSRPAWSRRSSRCARR